MAKVFGAICTYRRPADLTIMLDALHAQTVHPEQLVVVDNDDDPAVQRLVAGHAISETIQTRTIAGKDNPGPAGAFALAYEDLCDVASDDDLLLIFDDDDPPATSTVLEELLDVARDAFEDPAIAGVGLRGGILNLRTGIVRPSPSSPTARAEPADHLHGGWFPCYRFAALRAVGSFDPSYFWGFEELELGRRLTASGFELRVASELYFRVSAERPAKPRGGPLPPPSWRHFYRHRNLVRVLRRDHAWAALAVTVGTRLILKPTAYLLVSPRLAAWHLRTNFHAVTEGLRSRPASPKNGRYLPT